MWRATKGMFPDLSQCKTQDESQLLHCNLRTLLSFAQDRHLTQMTVISDRYNMMKSRKSMRVFAGFPKGTGTEPNDVAFSLALVPTSALSKQPSQEARRRVPVMVDIQPPCARQGSRLVRP
jgi:hypothetical protein